MNPLKAVRGTRDILPPDSAVWNRVEAIAREVFRVFNYQEIRTPIFEETALFARGVGEDTDIVGKEMYTFLDRNERSLTLRPENTAGVVRAVLSGGPLGIMAACMDAVIPYVHDRKQFGQSIGRAIRAWKDPSGEKRVAICASGGISHFVIDEDFDMRMLNAIKNQDTKTIFAEPANMFRSGTSETKNWICAAGILSSTNLQMNLIDYVPCYRSEAGTGSGMGYATWE